MAFKTTGIHSPGILWQAFMSKTKYDYMSWHGLYKEETFKSLVKRGNGWYIDQQTNS